MIRDTFHPLDKWRQREISGQTISTIPISSSLELYIQPHSANSAWLAPSLQASQTTGHVSHLPTQGVLPALSDNTADSQALRGHSPW